MQAFDNPSDPHASLSRVRKSSFISYFLENFKHFWIILWKEFEKFSKKLTLNF